MSQSASKSVSKSVSKSASKSVSQSVSHRNFLLKLCLVTSSLDGNADVDGGTS